MSFTNGIPQHNKVKALRQARKDVLTELGNNVALPIEQYNAIARRYHHLGIKLYMAVQEAGGSDSVILDTTTGSSYIITKAQAPNISIDSK